jgi:hypothetical protein
VFDAGTSDLSAFDSNTTNPDDASITIADQVAPWIVSGPTSFVSFARSASSAPVGYVGGGGSTGLAGALDVADATDDVLLDAIGTASVVGSSTESTLAGVSGVFALVLVVGRRSHDAMTAGKNARNPAAYRHRLDRDRRVTSGAIRDGSVTAFAV